MSQVNVNPPSGGAPGEPAGSSSAGFILGIVIAILVIAVLIYFLLLRGPADGDGADGDGDGLPLPSAVTLVHRA
jgi:hypothetical protein